MSEGKPLAILKHDAEGGLQLNDLYEFDYVGVVELFVDFILSFDVFEIFVFVATSLKKMLD